MKRRANQEPGDKAEQGKKTEARQRKCAESQERRMGNLTCADVIRTFARTAGAPSVSPTDISYGLGSWTSEWPFIVHRCSKNRNPAPGPSPPYLAVAYVFGGGKLGTSGVELGIFEDNENMPVLRNVASSSLSFKTRCSRVLLSPSCEPYSRSAAPAAKAARQNSLRGSRNTSARRTQRTPAAPRSPLEGG